MDIHSREAFEAFLQDYPGTILMVSHDRYFLDAIAERILELSAHGLTAYEDVYKRQGQYHRRSFCSSCLLPNQ